ncbi:MAG: type I phosphomannose isomerase catalytic subunit [Pirellulaceae bacterium]
MYPLRFQPLYRHYLWGGRRLETVLGKQLGDGDHYAESWEIVDRGPDQSVVENGPWAGRTLHDLIVEQPLEMLGAAADQRTCPLLFKFLDAQQPLSLQVHPNDDQAGRLTPPDRGKTEAWYVLHAEPGSVLYAGLKRGFDEPALRREIQRGTAELCLHRLQPRPGDCIFIRAGVPHALGAGLVIAEIQQASDTTYRLYDWNRVGPDGQPRPLHVDQALAVIDFEAGPPGIQTLQPTSDPRRTRLVECDKFVWDRWQCADTVELGGDGRFHIVAVTSGRLRVSGEPSGRPLCRGQTLWIPAAASPVQFTAQEPSELLDAYLPAAGPKPLARR